MYVRILYALLACGINGVALWLIFAMPPQFLVSKPPVTPPATLVAPALPPSSTRLRFVESFGNTSNRAESTNVNWDTRARSLSLARQDSVVQQEAIIAAGGGTIYVVWQELRADEGDIYAQQIDADGNRLWPVSIRINSDLGRARQTAPAGSVDPNGNLWVTWVDSRNSDRHIYVQQINPQGTKRWPNDIPVGLPATAPTATNIDQGSPAIALMADGSAVVTWHDNRRGDDDIYSQQVSPTGILQWPEDLRINTDGSQQAQTDPVVTTAANGELLVSWLDQRVGNGDIYVQRLSAGGTLVQKEQKVNSPTTFAAQKPAIHQSGNDSVIAWIGTDGNVYTQRLNAANQLLWAAPRPVNQRNQPAAIDTSPALVQLADYSVVVAWQRDQADLIVGQRVGTDGTLLWPGDLNLSGAHAALANSFMPPGLAHLDGMLFVAWTDRRLDQNGDIFLQSFNTGGQLQWNTAAHISDAAGAVRQQQPTVTALHDDTVLVWQDWRSETPALYMQTFSPAGIPRWANAIRVFSEAGAVEAPPIADVATNGNHISVVWADKRGDLSMVYLQQFDRAGNRLLPLPYRVAGQSAADAPQSNPKVGMDQQGHTYVVWEELHNNEYLIYGQELDPALNIRSAALIAKGRLPDLAVTDDGLLQLVWLALFGNDADVYTKQLRDFANPASVGNKLVNHLDGRADLFNPPAVALDTSGNAAVVWVDRRSSGVYVQRFADGATAMWQANRLVNSIPGTFSTTPDIAVTEDGTSVIVWQDFIAGEETIFAQSLDPQGQERWPTATLSAVIVSTETRHSRHPTLAVDAVGNTTIIWQDERQMNPDIYLQRLNSDGRTLLPQAIRIPQQDIFYRSQGTVTSNPINLAVGNIAVATLSAELERNGGAIAFQLSNDGGNAWHPVQLGVSHVFTRAGTALRWRAFLQTAPTRLAETPLIRHLQIEYDSVLQADPYEPDNLCPHGQMLQINGAPQRHTLETIGGIPAGDKDWIAFDATAGRDYLVSLQNPSPATKLQMALYPSCEQPFPVGVTQHGALGQRILLTGSQNSRYNIYLNTDESAPEGATIGAALPYAVAVRELITSGLAILVAGRLAMGDAAQVAVDQAADHAYHTLRSRGYRADQIHYLATGAQRDLDGDGVNDIAGALSVDTLRTAIQAWPIDHWSNHEVPPVNRTLILYFVGQGDNGRFTVGPHETVDAALLNLWLSNVEERATVEKSAIILDFNQAGTFLLPAGNAGTNRTMHSAQSGVRTVATDRQQSTGASRPTIAGDNRTLLAATHADGLAWPSPQGMLFSDLVWLALGEGASFRQAFLTAEATINAIGYRCGDSALPCQQPQYTDTKGMVTGTTATGDRGQEWGLLATIADQPLIVHAITATVEASQGRVSIEAVIANATATTQVEAHLIPTGYFTALPPTNSLPVRTHPVIPLPQIATDRHSLFSGTYQGELTTPTHTLVLYAWDLRSGGSGQMTKPDTMRFALPTILQVGPLPPDRFDLFLPLIESHSAAQ